MKTNVRETNGISIIEPVSRLMGPATSELRATVLSCVNASSAPSILFDLRRVRRVDSGGLGVLLSTYGVVISKSGKTGVVNVGKIKNLHIQGCLLNCFDHFETENVAIQAFLREPVFASKVT
ncbi:MAG: hypothetical protein OXI43_10015 [Candidatus Poribacteria bacterium]|nr:hypothetical protein [Candidatus Poribacteria bacterium]